MDNDYASKKYACLLLGAFGDALGAPVEFMTRSQMLEKYNVDVKNEDKIIGIKKLYTAYGIEGAITDDTQMTLALADSLIFLKNNMPQIHLTIDSYVVAVYGYIHWLKSQGYYHNEQYKGVMPLENTEITQMQVKQGPRAPGNTCLSSLANQTNPPTAADNYSKGCGTVMRVAPIALHFSQYIGQHKNIDYQFIYEYASKEASITHGHPTAQDASGYLAVVYAKLISNVKFTEAVLSSLKYCQSEETHDIVNKMLKLTKSEPSFANLQLLGEGWVAEEALAIGLYCANYALNHQLSHLDALSMSVSHDGDSDSTGSITGSLIGSSTGDTSQIEQLITSTSELYGITKLLRKTADSL